MKGKNALLVGILFLMLIGIMVFIFTRNKTENVEDSEDSVSSIVEDELQIILRHLNQTKFVHK